MYVFIGRTITLGLTFCRLSSVLVSDFFLRLRKHNTDEENTDVISTNPDIHWPASRSQRQSSSRGLFQSTTSAIITEMTIHDHDSSDYRYGGRGSSTRVEDFSQDNGTLYSRHRLSRFESQHSPNGVNKPDGFDMREQYELESWTPKMS